MLERTVSTLEPCKLRRVLPKTGTRTLRGPQKLRTGFWQHGALAAELSHGWPAAVKEGRHDSDGNPKHKSYRSPAVRPLEADLVASAFQLDFLYPSLQKRQTSSKSAASKRRQSSGQEKRRRYGTSSEAKAEASEEKLNGLENEAQPSSRQPGAKERAEVDGTLKDLSDDSRVLGTDPDAEYTTDSVLEAEQTAADEHERIDAELSPNAESVAKEQSGSGMTNADGEAFVDNFGKGLASTQEMDTALGAATDDKGLEHLDVYDTYVRLPPEHRLRYRGRVFVYISKARGIVARTRSTKLFRQITEEEWTDGVLDAGIRMYLRDKQRPYAVQLFKKGTRKAGLSGGLDLLLLSLFKSRSWSGVLNLWTTWYGSQLKAGKDVMAGEALEKLEVLDQKLPGLYFSFEQYLATGYSRELDPENLKSSSEAVNTLRSRFSKMALKRSSPKRAAVILAFYRSRTLYHRYLEMMTWKWGKTKEISRETADQLHQIYMDYRQLDNFKPNERVLHGMFEVYYPDNLKSLDMLHDDWCKAQGELSSPGFHKYFKLHAKLANVAATRTLLQRYMKAYPKWARLEGPRRLMKVYARQGDINAVKKLIPTIPAEFKGRYEKEVYSNILLACVGAGHYDEAVSTFESMRELRLLRSEDYAQVMHMCSRTGDLDGALRYFTLAQEDGVGLSLGIVGGLVRAFIANDRLKDAELVVVEMANRGVTSTDTWNDLIVANGLTGNLPRCYGILSVMKERKIDYSADTYEAILSAMVRYGQIPAAVALLKDAEKHNTFPITDAHYATVMAGAVRVRDRASAHRIAKKLQSKVTKTSFAAQVSLLGASTKLKLSKQEAKAVAVELVKSVQALGELRKEMVTSQTVDKAIATLSGLPDPDTPDGVTALTPSTKLIDVRPENLRRATGKIGKAASLLLQLREFFTNEELIGRFLELHPQQPGEPLPYRLIASLMKAYELDDNHSRVMETWETYWEQVSVYWTNDSGIARPNKQYSLTSLADTVVKSLRQTQDGAGLSLFLKRVYAANFKLSELTWNQAIQTLAELGRVEEAMSWCEVILMPRWRGWQRFPGTKDHTPERNHFTRALKRAQLDYHFVRTQLQTVTLLLEKYMQLRKHAAWSPADQTLLEIVERDNPRLVHAFSRAPPGFPRNTIKWLITGGVRFEGRIDSFVNKLTLEQARAMKAALSTLQRDAKTLSRKDLAEKAGEKAADLAALFQNGEKKSDEDDKAVIAALFEDVFFEHDGSLAGRAVVDERELPALDARVRAKQDVDLAEGSDIIAARMRRRQAWTYPRDRWTRWDDQWFGYGDKTNAPP